MVVVFSFRFTVRGIQGKGHAITETLNWTEETYKPHKLHSTNPLFIFFVASGRKKLTSIFKLCSPLKTKENVTQLEYWLSETWVNLAMGKL